jgi:tetratricopeptide (TPR) repeat protein
MPLGAEGEFARVTEQLEKALHTSGQPVRRGTIAHDHDVYMSLTDTAARLRDEAGIRTYAPLLAELAQRDGHRIFQAIAQRAWGVAHRLAGDYAQSATCFDRALQLFENANTASANGSGVLANARPGSAGDAPAHRWQIARTLTEMAELALARSDPNAARDLYSRALAEFESLRAVPDAQHTRTILEKLS